MNGYGQQDSYESGNVPPEGTYDFVVTSWGFTIVKWGKYAKHPKLQADCMIDAGEYAGVHLMLDPILMTDTRWGEGSFLDPIMKLNGIKNWDQNNLPDPAKATELFLSQFPKGAMRFRAPLHHKFSLETEELDENTKKKWANNVSRDKWEAHTGKKNVRAVFDWGDFFASRAPLACLSEPSGLTAAVQDTPGPDQAAPGQSGQPSFVPDDKLPF